MKLAQVLNEEATRRWPDAYGAGSIFAMQVTSGPETKGAQQMTLDFANNNLSGKSEWRDSEFRDYNTSRTRVCVTVGMMTTGYDCEDILNVVLARPIMSPTDFIQIKGRGTRLFTFKYEDGETKIERPKDSFGLFDFFANCEYFEEDFDYDQKLTTSGTSSSGAGRRRWRRHSHRFAANTSPDPIKTVEDQKIGKWGIRIDREMYRDRFAQQASEAAEKDPALKEAVETENWPLAEQRIRELLTDRADTEWDITELQKVYQTDRKPTLREILLRVFGVIPAIPTREQLAAEAYERFIATQDANATHTRELRTVFTAFLLDPISRQLLELGRFPELRALIRISMPRYQRFQQTSANV